MAESRMRKILKYALPMVLIAAASAALAVMIAKRPRRTLEKKIPVVSVTRPEIMTISEHLDFVGVMESDSAVPAVALVGGKVLGFHVEAGDEVSRDEVLATIDPEPYELVLDAAAAASVATENSFDRIERLYASGAVSKQAYDEALARRDASVAQMRQASLQLSYAEVKAPSGGVVLTTLAKAGDTVAQGTAVAIIGNLDDLVCRVDVPERHLLDVVKGGAVQFISRGTGRVAFGEVELIEPFVNPRSKTFKVKARLSDGSDRSAFVPGSTVTVRLLTRTFEDACCVPRSSLNGDDALYHVETDALAGAGAESEAEGRARGVARMIREDAVIGGNEDYVILAPEFFGSMIMTRGQNHVFDGQEVLVEIAGWDDGSGKRDGSGKMGEPGGSAGESKADSWAR